jgi:hypothetical protein
MARKAGVRNDAFVGVKDSPTKKIRLDQDFSSAYVVDVHNITETMLRIHLRNSMEHEVYLVLSIDGSAGW